MAAEPGEARAPAATAARNLRLQTGFMSESYHAAVDVYAPRGVKYQMVMQPIGYTSPATATLDAIFAALADPTRRAIIARLARGGASVGELAAPFSMSQPAISKHLKVLERAGLIWRDRDAQRRPSSLRAKPLAEASAWLEEYRRFWEASFHRLDGLLEELKTEEKPRPSRRKQ